MERNQSIKDYIESLFVKEDEAFDFAVKNSKEKGLPGIQVPSNVGQLLYLLTKLKSPKKCLEIGTLGGYSTLWIAKGMAENGKLLSLELDAKHRELALEHVHRAGFSDRVEILLGKATESLEKLILDQAGPYDLIFIDADKENYTLYLELALKLSQSGTVILSDNLIPKGEPIDNPHPNNGIAKSIYHYNRVLAAHPALETIPITTLVGEMGRIDALGFSIVK